MKRCALSLLLACLGLAALLLAAGCTSNLREPVQNTNSLPGVIEAELWGDHQYYEFGEPVRVRVTLKNVSHEIQVLGGKDENANKPVIEIQMGSSAERRLWSQEHPDEVKYLVTLKPGESYVVEWIVTPTVRGVCGFGAWWADPRGFRGAMGITIDYGIRPPGPMP
jgi:hypothetical protein